LPIIAITVTKHSKISRPSPRRKRDPRAADGRDALLKDVEDWLENLRSYLHELLVWRAEDPEGRLNLVPIYLLETTIDLMLDEGFRRKYQALLQRFPAARTRFMASDPDAGRALLQKLGVIEVIPPPSNRRKRGSVPAPSFPRPVVHFRARTGRNPTSTKPDNIRLLLDNVSFLGWHPQYLLVCSRCGWVQGALATTRAYASKVPHPCKQIGDWWSKQDRNERDRWKAMVDSFREEIWGFDALRHPTERRSELTRGPSSGQVARVLDVAMGLDPYPPGWPRALRVMNEQDRRQALQFLGQILAQLTCQICTRIGHVRFMPRFLLPIDADLSSTAQADLAADLSKRLDEAREKVSRNPQAKSVLWLPKRLPQIKLVDLAERFELRCEARRTKGGGQKPNLWLLAMWLIDVASASARRRTPSRQKKRPAKGSRMTWTDLMSEPGATPEDEAERELHELRRKVDALVASGRDHGALVSPVRELLDFHAYRHATSMLADFYVHEVIRTKLTELNRKPK
jgi:hypothetical protein